MSVVNKVIVTSRLETGDDINVSVKAEDRPFSSTDRKELDRRIAQSIIPNVENSLYFKIRLQQGVKGKDKSNWNKLKSIAEVNAILDEIFKDVG